SEPAGDDALIDRIDTAELQDALRAGAVDDLARVRADDFNKLANGRLDHLHDHMIFPPSLRNSVKRYLCCFSVGSRPNTVCEAILSTNSCVLGLSRCLLRWQNSATDCQVGLPSVLMKSSVPWSLFSVCCTAASQIFFIWSFETSALLPRPSMPWAKPSISVPADSSVRLRACTAAMISPSLSEASRRTRLAIFSYRVFLWPFIANAARRVYRFYSEPYPDRCTRAVDDPQRALPR